MTVRGSYAVRGRVDILTGVLLPSQGKRRSKDFRVLQQQPNKQTNKQTNKLPTIHEGPPGRVQKLKET